MKNSAAVTLRALWCAFLFILPFRWGYAAIFAEQPMYPANLAEWLFFTIQPFFLLEVITGALLLFTLCVHPRVPARDHALWIPALGFLSFLCSLTGLIHTTETAYAALFLRHSFAIAATATGIWWMSRHDGKFLPWALHALAIGAFFTALEGWTQHFGGLEQRFLDQLEYARTTGTALSLRMTQKFQQTRALGHFGDPNAYAAQLILVCPLLILDAVRLGRRCTSPRIGAWLLGGAAAIFSLGALFFSASRGAVLGAMGGTMLAFLFQYWKRIPKGMKILLAICFILGGVLLVWGINAFSERKMETVSTRMEYYETAWKLYCLHPVAGAGLGEYFPWHLRLEPWSGDAARDPHSLFFAQLSQCGIPGGLCALLLLGAPLFLALGLFRKEHEKSPWQTATVLGGWTAWNLHALTQFNYAILATAILSGFMGLFAFESGNTAIPEAPAGWRRLLPRLAFLAMALFLIAELFTIPAEKIYRQADDALSDHHCSYARRKSLLLEAIRQNPRTSYLPQRLADQAILQGDIATAEEAVAHLKAAAPHRCSTYLRELRLAILTGDAPRLQSALDAMTLWHPTSLDLWFWHAVDRYAPLLPPEARLRMTYFSLEKVSVEPEEILVDVFLPRDATRFQYEFFLKPVFQNALQESVTNRNLRFQIAEE